MAGVVSCRYWKGGFFTFGVVHSSSCKLRCAIEAQLICVQHYHLTGLPLGSFTRALYPAYLGNVLRVRAMNRKATLLSFDT